MKKEYEYFYRILGIKPGAALAEIEAAYLSLAKLYHPDHDQSPYAEIMYKKIHAAYRALLDMSLNSGTSTGATDRRNYSERTKEKKWASEKIADLESKFYGRAINSKMSLELDDLISIFEAH